MIYPIEYGCINKICPILAKAETQVSNTWFSAFINITTCLVSKERETNTNWHPMD